MTDTPTPAPVDLTPEVLARWEELLSGVRSRDARIAELEDARDEVQEKIAYLRRNCMGMEWWALVQKIGAVGSAEWARGYYWNTLVAEHRDKQVAAEVAQRAAERRIAELEAEAERWHEAALIGISHENELHEEVAARDAVIAEAAGWIKDEAFETGTDDPPVTEVWNVVGSDQLERILSAAPSSVLAARDAEKWDEGYGTDEECRMPRRNPYRAGADQ